MAKVNDTADLASFAFENEQEALAAHTFNELQLMAMKNELVTCVQERSNLAVEHELPNAQLAFLCRAEYLRGKQEQMVYILALHDSAKARMTVLIKEVVEQQAEDKQGE